MSPFKIFAFVMATFFRGKRLILEKRILSTDFRSLPNIASETREKIS